MLSEAAIHGLLTSQYTLGPIVACAPLATTLHRWYLIRTPHAAFVLRISPADLATMRHDEARLTFLHTLAGWDVPVVQPVRRRDHTYLGPLSLSAGAPVAVLYAYVPGVAPGRALTPAQSFAFGRAIAQLHQTTTAGPAGGDRPALPALDLIDQPAAVIGGWPAFHQHARLHAMTTQARRRLHDLPRVGPLFGFCHGDVHPMNIVIDGDRLTLLDFEWSGYGWRMYDVATFAWAMRGLPTERTLHNAFVDGYQTIRPLRCQEQATLPLFMGLRHLLLTSKSVAYTQRGIDTGRRITVDFLDQQLAQIQGWLDAAG